MIGSSDGCKTRSSWSSRSSRESTLSAEYLTKLVERLRREKHKSTTRRTYHEAWVNFNDFLIRLDKWPDAWDDRLVLYVAEIMDSMRPSSTIASYVSAVKSVLRDDGVDLGDNSVLLASVLRSCRINNKSESTLRLPIQKGLLQMIIDRFEI